MDTSLLESHLSLLKCFNKVLQCVLFWSFLFVGISLKSKTSMVDIDFRTETEQQQKKWKYETANFCVLVHGWVWESRCHWYDNHIIMVMVMRYSSLKDTRKQGTIDCNYFCWMNHGYCTWNARNRIIVLQINKIIVHANTFQFPNHSHRPSTFPNSYSEMSTQSTTAPYFPFSNRITMANRIFYTIYCVFSHSPTHFHSLTTLW